MVEYLPLVFATAQRASASSRYRCGGTPGPKGLLAYLHRCARQHPSSTIRTAGCVCCSSVRPAFETCVNDRSSDSSRAKMGDTASHRMVCIGGTHRKRRTHTHTHTHHTHTHTHLHIYTFTQTQDTGHRHGVRHLDAHLAHPVHVRPGTTAFTAIAGVTDRSVPWCWVTDRSMLH